MVERINKWLESPHVSESDKQTIKAMSESDLKEAFHQDVPFGTAGMRGLMGVGDNRLNVHTIRKATESYARYIINQGFKASVAIAYDNRNNSKYFAEEAAKVLANHNIQVHIFKELMPTPLLSYAVRELGCGGGIVITASHNPKEYNGFKVYDQSGRQLLPEEVLLVKEEMEKIDNPLDINPKYEDVKDNILVIPESLLTSYKTEVIKRFKTKDKKDIKIVFSPQHGTSYKLIPEILKESGFHVILVEEQMLPDGNFTNTKSPNPEDKGAYEYAVSYAKKYDADLIITTDPDADRIGIVIKDNDEYHLLNGNETASLLLNYLIESSSEDLKDKVIINTVVTSDIGELIAKEYNIKTFKTLTGFKYIGEIMNNLNPGEYLFGYEESFGTLPLDIVRDKDAVSAALLIAEMTQYYLNKDQTLLDVLDCIYQRHGTFIDVQDSISAPGIDGQKKIKKILAKVEALEVGQNQELVISQVENYQEGLIYTKDDKIEIDLPKENMFKLYFENLGWIAIRPSGTEPKIKLYYSAQGDSRETASLNLERMRIFFDQIIK